MSKYSSLLRFPEQVKLDSKDNILTPCQAVLIINKIEARIWNGLDVFQFLKKNKWQVEQELFNILLDYIGEYLPY